MKVVTNEDFISLNNNLSEYGLECLQHKIIIRLSRFIYKTINVNDTPAGLRTILIRNCSKKLNYDLRNKDEYLVPSKGKFNDYKEKTFDYFFSKFINSFLLNELKFNFPLFCKRIENNINILFIKFCKIFSKFEIDYIQIFF